MQAGRMRPWLLTAALALAALLVSVVALQRSQATRDEGDRLKQRIIQLVAEHSRLEHELAQPPFAEAGRAPLEAYLERIRRDGLPAHAEMRRRLVAMAETNSALLALAEAYEPAAGNDRYRAQLDELRAHVVTWNDRWNALFVTFMGGGDLGTAAHPFPSRLAEFMDK
jgi:hypothetical protein